MANIDIKVRKKQLIKENIHSSEIAMQGHNRVRLSVLVILGVRLAYLIFECIYLAVLNVQIPVLLELLTLPLLLALYMIYDGNKGLVYIIMVSSAARLVYHFTAINPTLPTDGVTVYTVIALVIYGIQFAFSIYLMASTRCEMYFSCMQKINLKLRSEMLGNNRK